MRIHFPNRQGVILAMYAHLTTTSSRSLHPNNFPNVAPPLSWFLRLTFTIIQLTNKGLASLFVFGLNNEQLWHLLTKFKTQAQNIPFALSRGARV